MSTNTMSGYRTKGQIAYEHLRSMIVTGELKPGQRLVIDQLAAELGVSKVPIREAVDRLIGEGWLDRNPHSGSFVPLLTPNDVRETAVLRATLEAEAIGYATALHDAESLRVAAECLDEMNGIDQDLAEFNVKFHAALIAPCQYGYLRMAAVDQLRRSSRFHTVLRLGNYATSTRDEHAELLRVVQNRDIVAASRLTKEHILSAAARLEELLLEQGE